MLTHSPSQQPARIVVDPAEVDARLQQLGPALTQDLMLEANQRGYEARLEATIAHAPTAAGTLHWHAFVPALRLALKVQGWSTKDHKNCPLIISPDRSMAIVVMTGNSETGKEFGNPTNQADKGAVMDEAVQKNIQYQLFENAALSELQKGKGGTQLWVLLYHVDAGAKDAREIRTELSLPSSFHKRKIVGWAERIILRSIPTDPSTRIAPSLPIEPIEVVVERKTGS
ncbi:hypothetical protein [Verminephrobacter aporrectodeae]|uniref:hypothetical protein n=1 Tax=Verminephrobacter aporrectodeae TaxID=1110389 RepID=UPI0022433ECE|nr:hypothetical protein [Verminephrobacter aporrectodeae]